MATPTSYKILFDRQTCWMFFSFEEKTFELIMFFSHLFITKTLNPMFMLIGCFDYIHNSKNRLIWFDCTVSQRDCEEPVIFVVLGFISTLLVWLLLLLYQQDQVFFVKQNHKRKRNKGKRKDPDNNNYYLFFSMGYF